MIRDEQLRIDLIEELTHEPSLAGRAIEVDVRMGMVWMTGYVNSIDERSAADRAAARIVGSGRIAGSVSIRRVRPETESAWVQDVRRSLET